jgi:hypothetical protein
LQPQAPSQVPWPTQGYANQGQPAQAGPAYHFPPPEPDPNYGYNQPAYAPQQWGPQDQRGYDLANYLPADSPPPFQQTAHHQHAYSEPEDYGDEFYEDEEPRRGRRWILIAAALVGAIGVGGALAYTYRSLIAPNHGRVPLVRAEHNIKVKPEQRGGKEFPGADKKLPNLAAASPPSESEAKTEPHADGPRKIKTIPVGPRPDQVPPPVSSTVPGITLEDTRPPSADPPSDAPPKTPPLTPPSTERVTIGDPPPAAAPPKADKDDDDPPAPPPPVKKREKSPPPADKVAVASPPKASGPALGYVVVVSSKTTHIDALKAFADAAEKHPQLLSAKTPDVQEVDLGEKGIRYRALVGPPGSRGAATTLCNQLKAAGQDCWVTEYRGS